MRSFIAKCKSCKRPAQVSADVAERREATRNPMGKIISPKRVSWRVEGGRYAGHTTRVEGGRYAGHTTRLEAAWNGRWTIELPCPGCGMELTFTAVAGEVTAHECNDKCMASHGPRCECSCGGANHGKSFAA